MVLRAYTLKHLLSGIARCKECSGGMSIAMRKDGDGYVCSKHRRYGTCDVKSMVPKALVENAVLAGAIGILKAADGVIRETVRDVVERRASAPKPDADAITAKLEAAKKDYKRAWNALRLLDDPPEDTVAEVNALAAKVKSLESEQARAAEPVDALLPKQIEAESLRRMRDLRARLSNPVTARETLDRMFPQGITVRFTPDAYEIEGGAKVMGDDGSGGATGGGDGGSTTILQPSGIRPPPSGIRTTPGHGARKPAPNAGSVNGTAAAIPASVGRTAGREP